MSDFKNPNEDELAGTEQPFVEHLIELRDRLIRAALAALGVLACWRSTLGPSQLYDLLALPLVAHLPEGTRMIATSVISPFLVPLKITLLAGFLPRCRWCSTRSGPLWRRACIRTRSGWCCRW